MENEREALAPETDSIDTTALPNLANTPALKHIRSPVEHSLTSNFKNALVTDTTLRKISQKAQQLILALLEDIEEEHFRALESCKVNNPILHSPETSFLMQKIDSLSNKIELLSSRPPSFADVVSFPPLEAPKSTLVIKPTNPQLIPKLASQLQQLKPPKDIQLTKLKVLQNSIELRTSSEPAKETLKKFLSENISPENQVEDKTPITSKIIFFNVPEDLKEEDLVEYIKIKLNQDKSLPLRISLIKRIGARKEKFEHWTVLLPKKTAQQLLQSNYVLHGFYKIFYKRHIFVKRCTHCQQLNHHSASSCQAKRPYCSTCGGRHNYNDCTAIALCCINCTDYNKQLQKTPNHDPAKLCDTNHSAASSTCPQYRIYFDKLRQLNK